jgi:hypothetical protein
MEPDTCLIPSDDCPDPVPVQPPIWVWIIYIATFIILLAFFTVIFLLFPLPDSENTAMYFDNCSDYNESCDLILDTHMRAVAECVYFNDHREERNGWCPRYSEEML